MLTILSLTCYVAFAQTNSISGIVLSGSDNEPIIGASIIVKGSTVGTTTDIDGKFTISKLPDSSKLIEVSFVGMVTQTLPIKATPYRIILKEDAQLLEEVIVQGAYGAQTKSSITGAISSVDSKKIEQRPVSSVTAVLEGASSGIQVNSSYGEPGSGASVRIRGFGSINGINAPLYVLDGVPYQGSISDINPADIDNISVLKDAASAALFGNKAANGVIIITTKKGKGDRISFNMTMNQGIYERGVSEYSKLNAKDWMETMWEGYRNEQLTNGATMANANQAASNNLIKDIVKYNVFNKTDDMLFDENGKIVSDAAMLAG